jgi:hypothetical protein
MKQKKNVLTSSSLTCSSYTFYAPQTDVPCTSTFQASPIPALLGYSDYVPTPYTTFAPTTIENGTIYAPSIEVRFQSTDMALMAILNQGGTITAQPGAGQSGGAKLGIGIGLGVAGVLVLMLLVVGACFFIRRRKKQQQQRSIQELHGDQRQNGWTGDETLLSPGDTIHSELNSHPYMKNELADTSRSDLPLVELHGDNRAVELPVEKADGRVEKAVDSPVEEKSHWNSFPPPPPSKDYYQAGVLNSNYSLSAAASRSETSVRSRSAHPEDSGTELHNQHWDGSSGRDQKLPVEELERRYQNFGQL